MVPLMLIAIINAYVLIQLIHYAFIHPSIYPLIGMIDGLQGLGLRLLAEGHSTPLLNIANAYMYATIQEAFEAIDRVGTILLLSDSTYHPLVVLVVVTQQLTYLLCITFAACRIEDCTQGVVALMQPPIVIAFTGRGNVTQGARSVFERLPHEYVRVCDLPSLKRDVQEGRRPVNQLYGVLVRTEDIVRPLQKTHNDDGDETEAETEAAFDKQHYYRYPHEYEPIFHLSVAPHITMLVNGIYWDKCFPRLISNEQLRAMSSQGGGGGGSCSLKVVADITCDVDGSVECLSRTSSIESPYYTYDPAAGITLDGIHKQGVLMLGIDNLPSELPRDASEYFGSALMPIIPQLLLHSASRLDSTDLFIANLPPVLQRACIAADGSLTPRWSIIDRLRHKYYNTTTAAPTAAVSTRDAFIISPTTQLRMVSVNVELVVSRSSTSGWMVEWMDG